MGSLSVTGRLAWPEDESTPPAPAAHEQGGRTLMPKRAEQKRREAEKSSHSETHEPWKKPGQASQDDDQQPTPNVVEQEKGKKGIR